MSASEKISIFFQIYYPGKQVVVLLYDLLYRGFGQITWAQKIHEGVVVATSFFLEDLLGPPGLPKKNFGSGTLTPYRSRDPPNATFGGPRANRGWGPQTPKIFLGSPGGPNRSSRKNEVATATPSWIF